MPGLALALLAASILGAGVAFGLFPALAIAAVVLIVLVAVRSKYAYAAIPVWAGTYLAFAPRAVVKVAGFGSGVVPVAGIATVLIAFAAIVVSSSQSWPMVRGALRRLAPAMVFLAVWALMVVLGVLTGYPERTLLGVLSPLTMFAFLVLGIVGRLAGEGFWRWFYACVLVAVWLCALAGLLQSGSGGLLFGEVASALRAWDAFAAAQYGIVAIFGRQMGLSVNPNAYALVGGFGVLYAIFAEGVHGFKRAILAVPAAAILIFSSSRAVLFAAIIAVVFDFLRQAVRLRWTPVVSRVLAFVGLAVAAVTAWLYAPERAIYFLNRSLAGLGGVVAGSATDANLAARFALWKQALSFVQLHPLGTLGPPQLALMTSIDNEYLVMLVQGSVLLLSLYVLALIALSRAGGVGGNSRLLTAMVVMVAMAAVSQGSLVSDASVAMVWLTAGACAAERVVFGPDDHVSRLSSAKVKEFAAKGAPDGYILRSGGSPNRRARRPASDGVL